MTTTLAPAVPESPPLVDAGWYAIWTRARHEQMVREQLERKGLDAFLPTVARWSRWKDRKKRIEWPLFPGYCFARFAPDGRLSVLTCAGVVSIVSFNGELAPIPAREIDAIRQLIERDDRQEELGRLPREVEATAGVDLVRPCVHPFRQGALVRIGTRGRRRATARAVELIGQGVSIQVDAADVKAY